MSAMHRTHRGEGFGLGITDFEEMQGLNLIPRVGRAGYACVVSVRRRRLRFNSFF